MSEYISTKIVLNDGTEIEDGRAGYAEGFLWCYLTGYTMQRAASLFFDVNKTERIVFEYGAEQNIYEGFTECINININVDGIVSVCLTKGATS